MRVLIVDDTSFMRLAVREIVEAEGWEVVGEAANGIDAVEFFMELNPDLVTMDLTMPGRSGVAATRLIVDEAPRACVVVASALGQETLMMEALHAGAKDFIVKPYRREVVLKTLKGAIESCRNDYAARATGEAQ